MEEKECIYLSKDDIIDIDQMDLKSNIDDNTIISVIDENGEETFYCPVENLALSDQTILVSKEDDIEDTEIVQETICESDVIMEDAVKMDSVEPEDIEENSVEEKKEPKLIVYGGKVVRAVPIEPEKPKRNFRVAPNTYKNLLNNPNYLNKINRKKLTMDSETKINPMVFKQQLLNSSDIVKSLDLAPETKTQMKRIYCGCVKLFGNPIRNMELYGESMSPKLSELYFRNCVTRNEESLESLEDMELLPVGYQVDIDRSNVKKITRNRLISKTKTHKKPKLEQSNIIILNNTEETTADSDHSDSKRVIQIIEGDKDNTFHLEFIPINLEETSLSATSDDLLESSSKEIIKNNFSCQQESHIRSLISAVKNTDVNASNFLTNSQDNQIMFIQIAN